ncbi:tRNA (guanosine(46)-N7)-methyltransferase TrmB [Campylobacter sp. MIT 99-7217]|uniref:tRNA (guanosine(46)-N7)-methyltransferase TrmB n=1 Tax=Campylobacter sp. MIT 99-7217 TaxID=535091 RepID=UPI0011598460|nr:tRNA (guanosine(46)-N7)-methyltransferase TrmB [Campylobacter sp. MIT 99-7217]TQR33771.1 tRNA (guanosine(46)-N7)-methyltransferase TrmB [Campylobacter sp. MIT 99-7217]
MPNFRCKELLDLNLPFEKDGVSFLWWAKNEHTCLIFTQVLNSSFFLQLSWDKQGFFIIKAEKTFKPSQIGYLQKALLVFKQNFCKQIISEAFSFKKTHLARKTSLIAYDTQKLLDQISLKKKIYVEIGFGSGRHLLFWANKNKDIFIIGIEIYTPALEQVAKLALAQNLDNVLLTQNDARLVFSILQSNSVDKIFLHFPVPWDKKPHRRVVSKSFVDECLRVLKCGGSFELRTDSKEYFDFSLQSFLEHEKLKAQIYKNASLDISSKYEDRWKRQEKDIYDLIVINENSSKELEQIKDFDLKELCFDKKKLENLRTAFKKQHFKGEDFFLHLEQIYVQEERLMLKISFGAFHKPEHAYLLLSKQSEFVFHKPFTTKENLKAFDKLKEILINLSKN